MIRRLFISIAVLTVVTGLAVAQPPPSCGLGLFPGEVQRVSKRAAEFVLDEFDGEPGLDLLYLASGDPSSLVLHTGIVAGRIGAPTEVHFDGHVAGGDVFDLDDDGDLDALAITSQPWLVRVFENRGAGEFVVVGEHAIPEGLYDVAVLQLDGDQHADLVLVGFQSPPVWLCVLPGAGDLGFLPPVIISAPSGSGDDHGFWDVTGADIDADGRDEIIVSSLDRLAALRWTGAGVSRVAWAAVPPFPSIEVVELVDDDSVELVALGGSIRTYRVSTRGFEQLHQLDIGVSWDAKRVRDWDGDGRSDLLVASGETVHVLINRNDGTLEPVDEMRLLTGPRGVDAGDLDLDGDLDLLTYDAERRGFSVIPRNGGDRWTLPIALATGVYTKRVETADLNGDGELELITASDYPGAIDVFAYDSRGELELLQSAGLPGASTLDMRLGDIDGNGTPDVVTTTHQPYRLAVNRVIDGHLTESEGYLTNGDVRRFDLGDLDGDGDLDIAMAIWNGSRIHLKINDGAGGFDESRYLDIGHKPVGVAMADVNGDGRLDLVSSNGSSRSVSLFTNLGDGAFSSPAHYPVPGSYWHLQDIEAADLDGDGFDDVVAAMYSGGSSGVAVLLSDGESGLRSSRAYATRSGCHGIAIHDVDRDGALDVVAAALSAGGSLVVFRGDGEGGLRRPLFHPVGETVGSASVGDVTGDGNPDLLTARGDVFVFPSLLCHPADLDGDGSIGSGDLELLLQGWGPCADRCPGDLDGDEVVGFHDLLRLLYWWDA